MFPLYTPIPLIFFDTPWQPWGTRGLQGVWGDRFSDVCRGYREILVAWGFVCFVGMAMATIWGGQQGRLGIVGRSLSYSTKTLQKHFQNLTLFSNSRVHSKLSCFQICKLYHVTLAAFLLCWLSFFYIFFIQKSK